MGKPKPPKRKKFDREKVDKTWLKEGALCWFKKSDKELSKRPPGKSSPRTCNSVVSSACCMHWDMDKADEISHPVLAELRLYTRDVQEL